MVASSWQKVIRILMHKLFLSFVLCSLMLVAFQPAPPNVTGRINYLTASGTNPVTIATEVQITQQHTTGPQVTVGKINGSNLQFFIYDSAGNLVASHGPVSVPTLEIGATETFSSSWNWDTPGLGDHTVEVCWSPGNSTNCTLAQASTTFYSVSTLNTALVVVAVLLIGAWFLYNGRLELQKMAV